MVFKNSNINQQFTLLIRQLSRQEYKVISLASKGYSNKEIARELFISVNTVKSHRQNIMAKFGIKGRSMMSNFLMTLYLKE